MDRFVAFIWPADCPERVRQVARWFAELKAKTTGWSVVFDADGLLVVALADDRGNLPTCTMDADSGVIVGTLFENGSESRGPLKALSPDASARITATCGDDLLRNYWGSFVCVLTEVDEDAVHVVRDPCGASPCFYSHVKGVVLLCSFVDDIADLSSIRPSIDWGAIQAFLVSNYLINSRTGLREFTELLPGERLTLKINRPPATARIWNPIAFASRPRLRPFAEMCAEFRDVAERCVAGWSSAGGKTVVRMSGGLDSSVVAGLVRRSRKDDVIGVHFVGRGYEGYELELAREAAAHAGIPLLEQTFERDTLGFRDASQAQRLARPTKQLLGTDADARLQVVCDATDCRSIMSGHGGDAVFLQQSIAADALVDYLMTNGLGAAFGGIAYDVAVLLETSVWHVLGEAASHLMRRRKWDPDAGVKEGGVSAHRDFASESFFDFSPGSIASTWLEEARSLPPCKAEQLRNVLALRNYHSVHGHAVARRSIHPLISQPLIELSLQTPTYLFNAGGTDRALEREAFADLIPERVARRTHKGFVNHSVTASIVDDLGYIRDLVLNGRCMDQGFLDRAKVERLLSPEGLLDDKSLPSVMNLIAVESWMAPWLGS